MVKEALINKTLQTLSKLPQEKIKEVNDFADYILKKHDEEVLQKGIGLSILPATPKHSNF